ncbi:metal-sensitive transcriptional regulator [Candidatus Aerophobetes bacterium]|nr:metal-sensitive transcriptional regulator [Candidatus Aerophobetes bacterium]
MVAGKVKEDLLKRLKKVEGQINGLERMVEKDAPCSDILMQISAVRAVVGKIDRYVNHAKLYEGLFFLSERRKL